MCSTNNELQSLKMKVFQSVFQAVDDLTRKNMKNPRMHRNISGSVLAG